MANTTAIDAYPMEKLYVEASTLCNLNCTMCMRRLWKDEPIGHMDMNLYRKLIDEIKEIDTIHTVFFGGVGEPTFHPQFEEMVRLAHDAGKKVECVTNGTMIGPGRIERLIEAGLSQVWVSVDGFDEEVYDTIREGGHFDLVRRNLIHINNLRMDKTKYMHFRTGLTFVAMKDNIGQIPELMKFAWRVSAADVKMTHVLPYDQKNAEQALFWRLLYDSAYELRPEDRDKTMFGTEGYRNNTHVDMPFFDINDTTIGPLAHLFKQPSTFSIMGDPLHRKQRHCKFVQENNVFVRWDGKVTQCMALLHPSETYLLGHHRVIDPYFFGDVNESTLQQVWDDPTYAAFRDRVRRFDFSFCTSCGGCHRIDGNREDCFGNEHPTCGACLWAQGFIQCP